MSERDAPARARRASARRCCAVALLCCCRPDASPRAPVDDVEIDLDAAGMGATIVAPARASVAAEADGVRITGGSDFDMVVRRGALDIWALRCELASARAPALTRFVEARPDRLIYAVEGPAGRGPSFHFVARGDAAGIPYYCRSAGDGVPTRRRLDPMLQACAALSFRRGDVAEHQRATLAQDRRVAKRDGDD